ncbi:MAG: DNA polymerase I [Alphaproteobacteria bacterium]|nr:MAG: DNA polymerase I [Alphaproteobacteria bacterium]
MNDMPTLWLLDASGFIYRAFHALPPLTRPDGTQVGAVFGFCSMLLKLATEQNGPRSLLVVYDAGRRSFRHDLYPEYKANRTETPPELVTQFPLLRDAVSSLGLPAVEAEGWEADDLIASYACAAAARGQHVIIVSSDKDLMQLVGPHVGMFDPMKMRNIREEEVREKFGVSPGQVVDVQALAGDSSDNVPGVPGIGVKTAAELINLYGDLDSLLARAPEIKQPKRRELLQTHAQAARLSRQLVTLSADAPRPLALESLTITRPDMASWVPFLEAQGFHSLVRRLSGATAAKPAPASPRQASLDMGDTPAPALSQTRTEYELVQTIARLEHWVALAQDAGYVAVDTETTSLTPSTTRLVGISLAVAPGQACYIPVSHAVDEAQLPLADIVQTLRPLLADPAVLKIAHNVKFDAQVLAQHGLTITPHDDTLLLSFVLDAGKHGHGLDELVQLHLHHKMLSFDEVTGTGKAKITFDRVPLDQACAYAAEDADYALRLWQTLRPRLLAESMETVYERLERPLAPIIAAMETAGILVDRQVLRDLGRDFTARMAVLEQDIHKLAGHPFNIGSPRQLGEVLFGEMGLPGGQKGKSGAYTTDADVLEAMAAQGVDIAARMLDWRALAKLTSTYTQSLEEQIDAKTGRVHTSFAMTGAMTGRLSSSDPNLQNIPIRSTDGLAIRRAFIAAPGNVLLSADYSQIELRLAAEMADVKALVEAFQTGQDIHRLTASQVFGIPLEAVTGTQRRNAKAINFGIIYGISAFGLARQLGCSHEQARQFLRAYFERYPELQAWMESCKAFARQHGYSRTLFGRKCHMRDINDRLPARRAYAERQAINAPVQGSNADIIKRAMIRLPQALTQAQLSASLLLQVHDELVFEVPETEVEATAQIVRQIMEGAASLRVPLIVETKWGLNWAQAHG